MKKIITFSFAMMASATMFGQTQLWDGEKQEVGTQGGFWADGSPTVVENPEKDGINTSDKCLKFIMSNDNKVIKLPFHDWITPSMDGSKRVSLMIKKPKSENVQIELSDPTNGTEGYWHKVATWYGDEGKWQKVVFDFSTNGDFDYPGLMTITAQTGDVEGEQEVYIDNVMIEPATKVNGQLLSGIEDHSLSGNISLSGAWMKGSCINTEGDWTNVNYNDFATLAGKLNDGITSIDMRRTTTKDVDVNGMRGDHSNVLVFADEAYSANNVVNNGKCANLVLDETKAFASPENFNAENVSITRPVYAGYNSMCLPFRVNKEDMKANNLLTYKENVEEDYQVKINFETKDAIDANVPFIAELGSDATEPLTFKNKGIVNTPASLGNTFLGTMAPMSGEGKYGLGTDNQFHKGGEKAHINAFHAYLEMPESQSAKAFVLAIDGETTGISAITNNGKSEAVKVYNLQGCQVATATSTKDLNLPAGIYIINNKKVVVK